MLTDMPAVRTWLPDALGQTHRRLCNQWRHLPVDRIDDALQEAAVVVLTTHPPPQSPPALRAFLLVVARRTLGRTLRSSRTVVPHPYGEREEAASNPETAFQHVLVKELLAAIHAGTLTVRTTRVVDRILSGESVIEISIALKLRKATVRQKLRDARAWLRTRASGANGKPGG